MLKTSRFRTERAQYTVLLEDREARQVAEQIMMREYRNIIAVFALSCHREIVPEVILYYAVYCKQ